MNPCVSILVPCYNYGAFLGQALDSLLGQSLLDIELIVIDDASSDNTPAVLNRYADDPRVQIIRHTKNQGHLRSYNEGLALARGKYVGIVSADDFCQCPDALERQVAVFEHNPSVGMVYSAHTMLDPDGRLTVVAPMPQDCIRAGFDEFRELLWGNYILHSGTLLRRDVQEALGPYDLSLPQSGDWDLWLRAAAAYDVGYIAEPLYVYRLHPANMQSKGIPPAQQADQNLRTLDKAFASLPPDAPSDIWRTRPAATHHALLQTAWFDLRNGRRLRAWLGIRHALAERWEMIVNPELTRLVLRLLSQSVLGRDRYEALFAGLKRLRLKSARSLA